MNNCNEKYHIIYSIGNFPTLRCYEQIRNDISYHKANVKIIAVGAGYAYGSLGATHQATEDIGAMRTLPDMVVCTPGDPIEAQAIAAISSSYDGPMYIRLGKAGENKVHNEVLLSMEIGDFVPVQVSNLNKVAVLACGNILAAVKQQIEVENLPYDLYSVPFVKPISNDSLINLVLKYPNGFITIEEHQLLCGMGSAIVEQLNDLYSKGVISNYPKVTRIAIPDEFADVVGTQQYLREYEKLKL